eukprot:PhM_4_TR17478/c0_g1_i1/m.33024
MNFFWEVISYNFPKNLRFCKNCIILHAQIFAVTKRHKDRRYIPMRELRDVAEQWKPPPNRLMQVPVLRYVCGVVLVNALRVYKGHPSWLLSRAVEVEHKKFVTWMDEHVPRKGISSALIDRERFEEEYMKNFHVATTWHRIYIVGICFTMLIIVFAFCGVEFDRVLSWYFKICGYTRAEVKEWWEKVLLQHAEIEVPEAYKSIVGEFARVETINGSRKIVFRGMELNNRDNTQKVMLLPCPWAGPRDFYRMIGDLSLECDALLMEQCCLEDLRVLPPATYFPLKTPLFESLGLHHRHWDVLRFGVPPPRLLPSKPKPRFMKLLIANSNPMLVRNVLRSRKVYGNKTEAKIAWGYLKPHLDQRNAEALPPEPVAQESKVGFEIRDDLSTAPQPTISSMPTVVGVPVTEDAPQTTKQTKEMDLEKQGGDVEKSNKKRMKFDSIAVPWSVWQVPNLASSLVRHGYKITRTFTYIWVDVDEVTDHYCDHFNIH